MDDDDDETALALSQDQAIARLTINRLVCALSGPLGKAMSQATDVVLESVNASPVARKRVRTFLGQGGALVLTVLGAPEGALSVLSSYGSHCAKTPTGVDKEGEHC